MGLFSSSYKYYAYAGSSSLLPAEDRQHTIKNLLIQAGIDNNASKSEAMTLGLLSDMYQRANKMAKYAAKPDGYLYGFPSVNNQTIFLPLSDLQPFIEEEVGGPIEVRSYYYGEWGAQAGTFFLEAKINETYTDTDYFGWRNNPSYSDDNWSPVDDEIEVPVLLRGEKGARYYATSNNQWTYVENPDGIFQVSFPYSGQEWDSSSKTYVTVSGTYDVEQTYDLTEFLEGTWLRVRYRMEGAGDQYLYWYYLVGSNENPALEDAITTQIFESQYLPIAILMHDKTWFDEHEPPVERLEEGLDRLLRYIVMDPTDLKEQFIENVLNPPDGEEGVDLDDVWDFFVHFSVPTRTHDNAAREYLYYWFKYLKTRTWTTFQNYEDWVNGPFILGLGAPQPYTELTVEEGEEYTGYIARYGWSYIETREFDGYFTPPGWERPLKPKEHWSDEWQRNDADYTFGLDLVHGPGNYTLPGGAASSGEGKSSEYQVVVRQHSNFDSETGETVSPKYEAVLIFGLSMEYQINTSLISVGTGQTPAGGYEDYRYRFVDCELFPEDPEQDSEFRWPIRIDQLKEVSRMRREPMLQEALAATVFLVDVVKVKWYQQTFFKWLIIIIVVVVVVITWQYELLGTIQSLAATAFAAGATGTALAYIALYVAYSFVLGYMISFAGNLIGGTWGQIFMIVATMYAFNGGFSLSNISNAWQGVTGNFGWATASSMLQTIKPYLDIAMLVYQEYELDKLEGEMKNFLKSARERYEELRDAWDQLGGPDTDIDVFGLARAMDNNYRAEYPDNYYQRVLNANPGIMSYDMINRFYEYALVLPEDGAEQNFFPAMFNDMALQRGQA